MQNYVDKTVVIFIGVIKLFLQVEFRPEKEFYHSAAYFIML